MGGSFLLKLNIDSRPIANKYREGKMKRTLERELKVREIAEREANETSDARREIVSVQGECATGTARAWRVFDLEGWRVSRVWLSSSVGRSRNRFCLIVIVLRCFAFWCSELLPRQRNLPVSFTQA